MKHLKAFGNIGAATLLLVLLAGPAQAQQAGVIQNVRGDVTIERNGQMIKPTADMPVMTSDRIITSPNASVGVTLKDNTRMSVGAKSDVALEEYKFNADNGEGKMAVRVLRGTLGMISGLINKKEGNTLEVRTRTATAGIRGTEFLIEVPDEN